MTFWAPATLIGSPSVRNFQNLHADQYALDVYDIQDIQDIQDFRDFQDICDFDKVQNFQDCRHLHGARDLRNFQFFRDFRDFRGDFETSGGFVDFRTVRDLSTSRNSRTLAGS